jgi:hypothetical protein
MRRAWKTHDIQVRHRSSLVGGIPTPLKNMSSSVGMMTFPIYSMVPNIPYIGWWFIPWLEYMESQKKSMVPVTTNQVIDGHSASKKK